MRNKNIKSKKRSSQNRVINRIKLLFIPHAHNKYQPHFIRGYGLLVLLGVALLLQGGYNAVSSGDVLGQSTNISSQNLLQKTNEIRTKVNAQPLQLNKQLASAAKAKANDMFTNQYWAHTSPSGVQPWEWIKQSGYEYKLAGENLAKGFSEPGAITRAWYNSPSHRKNLLSQDFTEVGFATVQGSLKGENTNITVAYYGTDEAVKSASSISNGSSFSTTTLNQSVGPIEKLGSTIQTMSPATLGIITLLSVACFVALFAHLYRNKLPVHAKARTLHHNHGLVKFTGLLGVLVAIIMFNDGGSI